MEATQPEIGSSFCSNSHREAVLGEFNGGKVFSAQCPKTHVVFLWNGRDAM